MSTLNIAMRLENVHASLAGTDVLRGINISFSLGRWTSILGQEYWSNDLMKKKY